MRIPEQRRLSAEAFMDWVAGRDGRFELIGGLVAEMMGGARQAHAVATSNILVALAPRAKGRGCRATASDPAVRTGPQGVRTPHVVIDCGPPDPATREAANPVLVVEVSSPSTSSIDVTDKLDESRAHPSIGAILLVDPDVIPVKLYRREAEGSWRVERHDDLAAHVDLPEIDAQLALSDIYDTLRPKERPLLRVISDDPAA